MPYNALGDRLRDPDYTAAFPFGRRLTREEILADRAEQRAAGRFVAFFEVPEEDIHKLSDEEIQPWHVGWKVQRDGGFGYSDEWEAGDGWTAQKIVVPSYSQVATIKMEVRIVGRRRKGKYGLNADRWYASLLLGHNHRVGLPVGEEDFKRRMRSCKSVKDALRQADKLDFAAAAAELRRRVYRPAPMRTYCIWKLEGAAWDRDTGMYRDRVLTSGAWVPFLTTVPVHNMDPYDWGGAGTFFACHWDRPAWNPKPDEKVTGWVPRGCLYRVGWGGWSGGGLQGGEHETVIASLIRDNVHIWLPYPEEPPA